jgi:hypothetical protein
MLNIILVKFTIKISLANFLKHENHSWRCMKTILILSILILALDGTSQEHAIYEIERYKVNDQNLKETLKKVDSALESYIKFANEGLMMSEQVWEHTDEGTGGATPLAWSRAEYIKLLWSKEIKHNVENLLQN